LAYMEEGSQRNQLLAKVLARKLHGWENSEFFCLDKLVEGESSWNNHAQNRRSTAYGIFQFLNSTWRMTDYSKSSDAEVQIRAGFQYIKKVYLTPCRAWNFKFATIKRNSSYAPHDLHGKAHAWIRRGYTGY